MILKYDQTNYKISSDGLERAIKDIKEGNKYINKLENEIIYYKIKIDKVIEILKLCDSQCAKEVLEILKGGSNE
jgi:hypothetical protein